MGKGVSTSWGKYRFVTLGTFENGPTIYCRDDQQRVGV